MSTKISALTAASAINVTDASVLPLVDGTTTTVKVSIAQLRTQITSALCTFTNGVTVSSGGLTANGLVVSTSATLAGFTSSAGCTISSGGLIITSGGFLSNAITSSGVTICQGPLTIASTATSVAGSGTDLVFGATTQSTVGAVGAAAALPGQPLGYIVFYKGTTKCVFPYYNG